MGNLYRNLKSNISRMAMAAATFAVTATSVAAQDGLDTEKPDSYSNPEFVECVADAMSDAYPDQAIEISKNPSYKGENISIGFGNAIFGDYATANISSFKSNGTIDRVGLSSKLGGEKEQLGQIHGQTAEFKFFENRAPHENVGMSASFNAAMEGISECPTSMLIINAQKFSGEDMVVQAKNVVPSLDQ